MPGAAGRARVVLVSTYEMGHQPLGLAAPAAALRQAGHEVRTLDLAVESPEAERFTDADLVGISVPMHTAARLAVELAGRLRRLQPGTHIAFYGLYASPLQALLTGRGLADSVIGGEYEPGLVAVADRLAADERGATTTPIDGLGASPSFARQRYPLPDRRGLPPLDAYARVDLGGEQRLAGYVEATRGCAHHCTHCPLTPVYGGRLRLVQPEIVLDDIDQLVEAGARHITFGDPDFLNAAPHALRIADELHGRHPDVTFDATIKVEHLLEHAALLGRLRDDGCLFITSAFESTNDSILRELEKGHDGADMEQALDLAARAGIPLRPTWVAHTPWTTAEDFLDLIAFVERHDLVDHVQPVQYALRLLLPPGSPLVGRLRGQGLLGHFDEESLTYTWSSPDPRLEELQRELQGVVEASACTGCREPAGETFGQVRELAYAYLRGTAAPRAAGTVRRRAVPGLTEAWFC